MQVGPLIACHEARPRRVAEPRIDTGEEAAKPARHRRSIAVAVGAAPAAEALCPEGEITRGAARSERRLDREVRRAGVARGIGQLRSAKRKRGQFAGSAVI